MANGDRAKELLRSARMSVESYRAALEKFGGGSAPAAAAESKRGKTTAAPLDIRPPAARNKPKPKHAKAKPSKYAKRAGHNPPKPEYSQPVGVLPPPGLGLPKEVRSQLRAHSDWPKFEREARPSRNIEDVRAKSPPTKYQDRVPQG